METFDKPRMIVLLLIVVGITLLTFAIAEISFAPSTVSYCLGAMAGAAWALLLWLYSDYRDEHQEKNL